MRVRAVGCIESAFSRISLGDESNVGPVEAAPYRRGSGCHCGYVASSKPGDHWLPICGTGTCPRSVSRSTA